MIREFLKLAMSSVMMLSLWSGTAAAALPAATSPTGQPAVSTDSRPAPVVRRLGQGHARPEAQYKEGELIVKFRKTATEAGKQRVHGKMGATRLKEFKALRIHHVALKKGTSVKDAVKQYQSEPDVEYAEPNYLYSAQALPNDPRFTELWGMRNTGQTGGKAGADINAPGAWDTVTGSSDVVVATIDTGIDYTHPDLAPNVWRNPWETAGDGVDNDGDGYVDDIYGIDPANKDADPMDDHGHGTHVAGTIGAAGSNGVGVVGVNWNVKIMACKFLNASGRGATADAISCLQYVKAMKDKGVNIVATNNSWGGGGYSQALYDAIKAMPDVLFIAAAGNDGVDDDNYPHYPGAFDLPNVIAVGATDANDQLAAFSEFGKHSVQVGAPGVKILSTLPAVNTWNITGGYGLLNGTSMATPHVTGLAALLKAQDPSRDWRTIKNLILSGGDSIPALDGKTVTGKRINAAGSVTCQDRPLLVVRNIASSLVPGVPATVSVLSINCGSPVGPVTVTTSGGASFTLADDGTGSDQAAGDGLFTGVWTPSSASEQLTITSPAGSLSVVVPALGIHTHQPEANIRAPYRQTLSAAGGLPPYNWSIVSGDLPPGLILADASGEISGRPTATGSYTFTARVIDSAGGSAQAAITMNVSDDYILEAAAQTYDGGDTDQSSATTYDKDGNYYIALSTRTGNHNFDAMLSKYDPSGTLLWSRTYSTPSDDYARDVKVDNSGNVYLAGEIQQLQGTTWLVDWFLVKYDASGNVIWSRTYDSGGGQNQVSEVSQDFLGGIAPDAAGNLYVSGERSLWQPATSSWDDRMETVKFDASGNVLWEKVNALAASYPNGHAYSSGVAVDSSGNVYAAGGIGYNSTEPDPSYPGYYCRTSNAVVIKYDPSGNEVWTNSSLQMDNSSCYRYNVLGTFGGVTADAAGNVYLAGGPLWSDRCVTAKYDPAGNLLWQSTYTPPSNWDYPVCNAIAADGAGNSYVTAATDNVSLGSSFYTVLKYGADGSPLWEKTLPAGPDTNGNYGGAYGIALAGNGDIRATGDIFNGVSMDALTVLLQDTSALLNVNAAPLPDAVRGESYLAGFTATSGVGPYSWSLITGVLPAGLVLNTATGALSGVPAAAGSYAFTVQVTDAAGATASLPRVLLVKNPTPRVTGFLPANGAVVPPNTAPQASFSQPLDPSSVNEATFTLTTGDAPRAVAAGVSHTAVLHNDGTVTAWGANYQGQTTVPAGLSGVTAISSWWDHTLALKGDGTVVAWGLDETGECDVPADLTGVTAIAAGGFHSLAVKSDGTVAGWGADSFGQATPPPGLTGVVAVSAGTYHSVAVKNDGTVVTWGWTDYAGEPPAGLTGVKAVAAGYSYTLALTKDGTVTGWGSDGDGALEIPAGLSGVTAIAAGDFHSMALKGDGTVVAWGRNVEGQCAVPPGLAGVVAIAAAGSRSMALKSDGTVVAWGDNISGQSTVPADLATPIHVVSGSVSYQPATSTMTFTPATLLSQGSTYFATVANVASDAGVPLAAPVSWTFSTTPAVQITTTATPPGTMGVPYSQTLAATGGTSPYSWSISKGALPGGLACNADTGEIAGVPNAPGSFSFTARVTDALQGSASMPLAIFIPDQACLRSPVKLTGHIAASYPDFATAYLQVADNDIVKLRDFDYLGDLVFDRDVKISLLGGWDCLYNTSSSMSRLHDRLRISAGSVKVDGLRLQ